MLICGQVMAEEDVELDLGEAGRNWRRPDAPAVIPATDSLGEHVLLCHQLRCTAGAACICQPQGVPLKPLVPTCSVPAAGD